MPITKIRIHPAIGIARLGNSPDDFFIGPEKPWDRSAPPGGYKDAACRIKRQAARFRLWAYDENDRPMREITATDATISWTVELANTKAAAKIYSPGYQSNELRNRSVAGAEREGLKITPGARTLSGPTQRALFDGGAFRYPGQPPASVPLGEIRTDADGRLIVLGGFGNSGHAGGSTTLNFDNNDRWYDDISDGQVTATVTLRGGPTPTPVVGAWVIVGPPKFAPPIDNVITLYDFLYDLFNRQGRLTANGLHPPVSKPSFTQHIYPILRSAKNISGVYQTGMAAHASITYPVPAGSARVAIFGRLTDPATGDDTHPTDMPLLNDNPARTTTLTPTQYEWMRKWKDDDGADSQIYSDWTGHPAPPADITPAGLDKAALENACGGGFYPGMEAGEFLMEDPNTRPADSKYSEPFRFDRGKVAPGQVTERMAVPWQADFYACGGSWWPAVRPARVIPQGTNSYQDWVRGIGSGYDMTQKWHAAGFVVEQSGRFVETERCASTYITLLTPSLDFRDIPEGPGGMPRSQGLPIEFEILSPGVSVTLEFVSGPTAPSLTRVNMGPFSVGPTTDTAPQRLRVWIVYTTQGAGHAVSDEVTMRNPTTMETWRVAVAANTVGRKKAAVALVLDRSGSMREDRGDGQRKIDSLRLAASNFLELMWPGDGLALVRYNQDAQVLLPLAMLGPNDGTDPARNAAQTKIVGSDLNPGGSTSIGDGLDAGNSQVTGSPGYDTQALVVLTDGKENTPKYIADVAGAIRSHVYAVGLGTAENTSAPVLQALSGNHGGYMLITGPISADNAFILSKYFVQILAGISNAEVVIDPQGRLKAGDVHRIPFTVTEADSGLDVILLTPHPERVEFKLETPLGNIIDPGIAASRSSIRHRASLGMAYYRLSVPQEIRPARRDHEGVWHAVLSAGPATAVLGEGPRTGEGYWVGAHKLSPIPYDMMVHAYSDLRLRVDLVQSSFEPGARAVVRLDLSQSGMPMAENIHARLEVIDPRGVRRDLVLSGDGGLGLQHTCETSVAGAYKLHLRVRGITLGGWPFHREITRTVAVWHGADQTPARPELGEDGRPLSCCSWLLRKLSQLIRCMLMMR